MEVLVAFIAFFATVFGIMYMFYTTRNRERLALIEKGAEASLFNTGKQPAFSFNKLTLKLGMFFIGISVGILAGAILSGLDIFDDGVSYLSMIFLFGGLSLVLYYIIDNKNR
jgi:ABC-type Fe3+-siderophore transport system permease subunit